MPVLEKIGSTMVPVALKNINIASTSLACGNKNSGHLWLDYTKLQGSFKGAIIFYPEGGPKNSASRHPPPGKKMIAP